MNLAKPGMPYPFTTKRIDATFLTKLLALAEKIWNETNLQEVARDWMFLDVLNELWRHLNGK